MELIVNREIDRLKALGYDSVVENAFLTIDSVSQHFDNLDFMVLTGIHLPYSKSVNGVNSFKLHLLSRTESKMLELSNSELAKGFIVREKLATKLISLSLDETDALPIHLTFTRITPVMTHRISMDAQNVSSKPRTIESKSETKQEPAKEQLTKENKK